MTTTELTNTQITTALDLVLDRLHAPSPGRRYALIGTAAAVLHGVPTTAADIDIAVEHRATVDEAARLFGAATPVWIPHSSQYFCAVKVQDIRVEFSTVENQKPSTHREAGGNGAYLHARAVRLDRHHIPAVRLELRLATEVARDRQDQTRHLIGHLREHGFDKDLLTHAFTAANVPAARQNTVLNALA
jgi:hypothetical protein